MKPSRFEQAAPLARSEKAALLRLLAAADAIDFGGDPRPFRREFHRPIKQSTTIRLDADILDWLKAQGKGYQTRLNGLLRAAMAADAEQSSGAASAREGTPLQIRF